MVIEARAISSGVTFSMLGGLLRRFIDMLDEDLFVICIALLELSHEFLALFVFLLFLLLCHPASLSISSLLYFTSKIELFFGRLVAYRRMLR